MLSRLSRKSLVQGKRFVHTVARSGEQATQGQEPVVVYDSNEFEEFNKLTTNSGGDVHSWDGHLSSSSMKSKFFSLVPFYIEAVSNV